MAAPASAASIDCWAISVGVIGKASDMVGVWIPPVTAHEMMTLLFAAAIRSSPNEPVSFIPQPIALIG